MRPVAQMFDSNTLVITDNKINSPTQYQVMQLPQSYFGIYNYVPKNSQWTPERRFSFSVNRIDSKRLSLFLELMLRTNIPNSRDIDFERDFVNFNCWSWDSSNDSPAALQQNFAKVMSFIPDNLRNIYQKTYEELLPRMPYRNYDMTMEQVHVHAWLNMVVETYSGDTVIALSEKLFRALVTPVPWVVYGGRYTVTYLRQLGFDVLDDLIQHRYDYELENNTGTFGDKMVDFVREAHDAVENFKQMPWEKLNQRCQSAAAHNQKLLASMQNKWPEDFARWLPDVASSIK